MKLSFKNIKIENFLSIGKTEISLDDNGYVFVKGINENVNDNAASNGSGKSSIFEAISWVLTGETIRGCSKDIVNIHGDNGALVEIEFNIDEDNYRIIRTKDHKEYKTNLKIYINNEDKSGKGIRDSEKLLNQYIPDLTSSLLGSVIILGQGMPQRFSNNTPSGRKEVLEKLSKSDFMIEDLKNRINARKSNLNQELRNSEDKILQLNTTLDITTDNKEQASKALDSLINSPNYDETIKELEQEINNLNLMIQNSSDLFNEKLSLYDELHNKKEQLQSNFNSKIKIIEDKFNDDLITINADYTEKTSYYKATQIELQRMESISDICPTCGQKIPTVHKPDTTEITEKLTLLNNELNEIKNKKELIENQLKQEKSALELEYAKENEQLSKSIHEIKINMNEVQADLNANKNKLDEKNKQLINLNTEKNNLNKNIQDFKDKLCKYNAEITCLQQDILYYNNIKEDTELRLGIINKFNSLITRDFRGYLLSNVIEFIDKKAKEYCKDIFLTDKIEFCLNGNNISISYDNKEYEVLSGGEKQKVDLIIQFAIRDMLCKFLNFSSNILVVDEVFDNLDKIGCQQVINLISTKLNDISSIFIISHHTDIDIPYDKELVVIKDNNGISRIQQ